LTSSFESLERNELRLVFGQAFQGINPGVFSATSEVILQLSDGGLAGENVPLATQLVKARGIEVILAIDASADTSQSWANGTSLFATQARSRLLPSGTIDMPPLPADLNAFSQGGYASRPTFFGCEGGSNAS
jgi:lysophospholipase